MYPRDRAIWIRLLWTRSAIANLLVPAVQCAGIVVQHTSNPSGMNDFQPAKDMKEKIFYLCKRSEFKSHQQILCRNLVNIVQQFNILSGICLKYCLKYLDLLRASADLTDLLDLPFGCRSEA